MYSYFGPWAATPPQGECGCLAASGHATPPRTRLPASCPSSSVNPWRLLESGSPLWEISWEMAPAIKAQEAGAPEEIALATAGELGAGAHGLIETSPAIPSCSRPVEAAMPETKGAAVPATPPRAFLVTPPCPPSSGKREPSPSRSSASPGSSGGRLSPHIDAGGFQLVVGRTGKEKSGGKVPTRRRGRGRGRGVGVCDFCDDYDYGIKQVAGNDDYEYGIKQAGNDDYDYDEARYLFF